MAERKPFLLRIDRDVLDAVHRWADDDLRSVNGQIEFVLRDALKRAGRNATAAKRRAEVDAEVEVEAAVDTEVIVDADADVVADAKPDPDRRAP